MTGSDARMSVNDLLQAAEEASQKGVPVDWRAVAYQVANAATNYIANLEEQLDEYPRGEGE